MKYEESASCAEEFGSKTGTLDRVKIGSADARSASAARMASTGNRSEGQSIGIRAASMRFSRLFATRVERGEANASAAKTAKKIKKAVDLD
jgi:hypothetical protein